MGRGADDACAPGTASCEKWDLPEHEATVPPFFLDTFEVTQERFQKFIDAYEGLPEQGAGSISYAPGSGWKPDFDVLMSDDTNAAKTAMAMRRSWSSETQQQNQSAVLVTWAEAFLFCVWDGGRLPTEAEWEFAAVGGDENRLYPWGDDESDLANKVTLCYYQDLCADGYDLCDQAVDCLSLGDREFRVGSKPGGQARWGQQNMADGWTEWVYDRFEEYESAACKDASCVQIPQTTEENRSKRGGTSNSVISGAFRSARRPWSENTGAPTYWGKAAFRCVHDVPKQ